MKTLGNTDSGLIPSKLALLTGTVLAKSTLYYLVKIYQTAHAYTIVIFQWLYGFLLVEIK